MIEKSASIKLWITVKLASKYQNHSWNYSEGTLQQKTIFLKLCNPTLGYFVMLNAQVTGINLSPLENHYFFTSFQDHMETISLIYSSMTSQN